MFVVYLASCYDFFLLDCGTVPTMVSFFIWFPYMSKHTGVLINSSLHLT